jgi:hypothetical protein
MWQNAPGTKRDRNRARQRVYAWLADGMGIPPSSCHIALFSAQDCWAAMWAIALHPPTTRPPEGSQRRQGQSTG